MAPLTAAYIHNQKESDVPVKFSVMEKLAEEQKQSAASGQVTLDSSAKLLHLQVQLVLIKLNGFLFVFHAQTIRRLTKVRDLS